MYVSGLVERLADERRLARGPAAGPGDARSALGEARTSRPPAAFLRVAHSGAVGLHRFKRGRREQTGLEVAIARHAESVIAPFVDTPEGEVARRIFLRLVQFGEGRPNTRRQQSVEQLRAGHDPVEFEKLLKHLTDHRLVTQSGDESTGRRKADIATRR